MSSTSFVSTAIATVIILLFVGFPVYVGITNRHIGKTLKTVAEAKRAAKNSALIGLGLGILWLLVEGVVWFTKGAQDPPAFIYSTVITASLILSCIGLLCYFFWQAHQRLKDFRRGEPESTPPIE